MDRQSDKITALYCRTDKPFNIGRDADIAHAQTDRLSRYVKEHGLKNPKFFCDWGFSGTTPNRPEYQRMLQEVEAGKVANLVVVNLSRLTRSSIDAGELISNVFPRNGVVLHSVKEGGEIIDSLTQMQKCIIERYRQDAEGRQE